MLNVFIYFFCFIPGPSLKPCSVRLTRLTPEAIILWCKGQKSVGTNTPEGFWKMLTPICPCQKIPLIVLDEEISSKRINKSTSTRCTCNGSKSLNFLAAQAKEPLYNIQTQTKHYHHEKQSIPDNFLRPSYRNVLGNVLQGSGGLNMVSTSSTTYSYSDFKEGSNSVLYNTLHLSGAPLNYKRVLHRRPLTVVPPITVAVSKEIRNLTIDQPLKMLPHNKNVPFIKVNFSRSILDAIKWYTKDDTFVDSAVTSDHFLMREKSIIGYEDQSQENIKPIPKITLPNSYKPINYFDICLNNNDRDYCFELSSDGTSNLVTRRGGRRYINREPCPSCFHGRDNFCVYEYIRQAKMAGITLHKNQKPLQIMFIKFVLAEKK